MSAYAFLTVQEVADLLKIKKTTVYDLIKRGKLPSSRVGKQLRISEQALTQYVQNSDAAPEPRERTLAESAVRPADSLILCGQDRALDFITNYMGAQPDCPGVLRSNQGSSNSLSALYQRKVDIATAHLWDQETGEYNYPFITRLVPGCALVAVRLFGRMQGFYVRKDNPLGITGWEDLKRGDLRYVNREKGSGTRVLLDSRLKSMGLAAGALRGYEREQYSHLSVASAVACGDGDLGLGCEHGGQQVGDLTFVPLQLEWYDMVFFADVEPTLPYRVILDYITSARFYRELSSLGGYDISQTGKIKRL